MTGGTGPELTPGPTEPQARARAREPIADRDLLLLRGRDLHLIEGAYWLDGFTFGGIAGLFSWMVAYDGFRQPLVALGIWTVLAAWCLTRRRVRLQRSQIWRHEP